MAWLERALRPQRKIFRMANGLNKQVSIKIRRIEMVGRRSQDVEDLLNRSCLKPGKLGVGKRKIIIINKHPNAISGHILTSAPNVIAPGIGDLLLAGLDSLPVLGRSQ